MYERGLGVPCDDTLAFKWFADAAAQGEAFALCKLGTAFPSYNPYVFVLMLI